MTLADLLNNFTPYKDWVVVRVITVKSKNPLFLEKSRLTPSSKISPEQLNKEVIAYIRRDLTNNHVEMEVYTDET